MVRFKTIGCIATLAIAGAIAGLWAGPAFAGGGGCLRGEPPVDGAWTTIELIDACFTPAVTHVASGSQVTWVNRDAFEHNVIGIGGSWGTGETLLKGDQISYRFDANGVYVYACYLHPGMVGAVVVGDGSGAADLTRVASVTDAAPSAAPAVAATEPESSSGTLPSSLVAGAIGSLIGAVAAIAALSRRKRVIGA